MTYSKDLHTFTQGLRWLEIYTIFSLHRSSVYELLHEWQSKQVNTNLNCFPMCPCVSQLEGSAAYIHVSLFFLVSLASSLLLPRVYPKIPFPWWTLPLLVVSTILSFVSLSRKKHSAVMTDEVLSKSTATPSQRGNPKAPPPPILAPEVSLSLHGLSAAQIWPPRTHPSTMYLATNPSSSKQIFPAVQPRRSEASTRLIQPPSTGCSTVKDLVAYASFPVSTTVAAIEQTMVTHPAIPDCQTNLRKRSSNAGRSTRVLLASPVADNGSRNACGGEDLSAAAAASSSAARLVATLHSASAVRQGVATHHELKQPYVSLVSETCGWSLGSCCVLCCVACALQQFNICSNICFAEIYIVLARHDGVITCIWACSLNIQVWKLHVSVASNFGLVLSNFEPGWTLAPAILDFPRITHEGFKKVLSHGNQVSTSDSNMYLLWIFNNRQVCGVQANAFDIKND